MMSTLARRALEQIANSAVAGIWDAHRGCAALAGAFLVNRGLVAGEAAAALKELLQGRTLAAPATEDAVTFDAVSFAEFSETLVGELAFAADQPRELGHDVIYSAYVLRAIEVFEVQPWRGLLVAMIALIRKLQASGPGWITVNGRNEVRPLPGAEAPAVENVWSVFAELERPLASELGDMQLGHILTHGHAITVVEPYAAPELRLALRRGLGRRVRALQFAAGEQTSRAPLPRRAIDPRRAEYWSTVAQLGDMHGHAFKYAYSFLELRRDPIRRSDLEAFGRICWPDSDYPQVALPDPN